MSNINLERVNPIENLKIEIDLAAEHKAAIAQVMAGLGALQNRKADCRPDNIKRRAQTATARFAAGEITIDEALAAAALSGVDDTGCRRIAEALQTAIFFAEREAQAAAAPTVIAAFTLRTDELRKRTAAIETSEQENAEIAGIDFQPSETAKRMRSTFEHSLERLRAIRDRGELPSKAELRSLAE